MSSKDLPIIEIDDASGFCFGVVNAITKAEEELSENDTLYCLGDIVHNSEEVSRLMAKGLRTVSHSDLTKLGGCKVLLRAHGEPPSTYLTAEREGIHLIDATCPVVLRLQHRIKEAYDKRDGRQIVIYGKPGHAEVNGLVGQTDGTAIVVESIEDLSRIDYSHDVDLYSQTTMSIHGLRTIVAEIAGRMHKGAKFTYSDTICRQVSNRVGKLRDFAAAHDVVIFVSDRKSSNGKVLYRECLDVNPRTYFVSQPSDVQTSMAEGASTIGICGATSTPRWIMERIKSCLVNG